MRIFQGAGLAAMSLALAAALGGSAFAADPGVIATAPTGAGAPVVAAAPTSAAPPAKDATAAQIAAWVAPDDASSQPGPDAPLPRTIHGEVGAGLGSGGYRDVYGVADIPVGQASDVVVAVSSTSGDVRGGRYGGGYAYGASALALGFYANGASGAAPGCDRQPWGWGPPQLSMTAPGAAECGGDPSP